MDDIKVTFLNSGVGALLNRSIDLFGVNTELFKIGDEANFTVSPSETEPRGNLTFTGTSDAIKSKYFDNDRSLRLSFSIAEAFESLIIGNIVVYSLYRGVLKPFLSIVFPEVIFKENSGTEGVNPDFPYAGNRLIVGITVKYIEADELTASYTVNIVSPNYANIISFESDLAVPDPIDNPHDQFIVNRMDVINGTPTFVAKGADNEYYSSPLFMNLGSPKYGIIDSDTTQRAHWIWGGGYHYKEEWYNGIYGGSNYTSVGDQIIILGGESY